MGFGDSFHFYSYSSDDGSTYAVKLSAAAATAGGFSTTVDPRSVKVWPYHSKNLRHVLGKATGGGRTKLPIATNTNTLYQTGGSFTTLHGTYAVEGAIGEKRKLNSIA